MIHTKQMFRKKFVNWHFAYSAVSQYISYKVEARNYYRNVNTAKKTVLRLGYIFECSCKFEQCMACPSPVSGKWVCFTEGSDLQYAAIMSNNKEENINTLYTLINHCNTSHVQFKGGLRWRSKVIYGPHVATQLVTQGYYELVRSTGGLQNIMFYR